MELGRSFALIRLASRAVVLRDQEREPMSSERLGENFKSVFLRTCKNLGLEYSERCACAGRERLLLPGIQQEVDGLPAGSSLMTRSEARAS